MKIEITYTKYGLKEARLYKLKNFWIISIWKEIDWYRGSDVRKQIAAWKELHRVEEIKDLTV